jgi:2-polyprenyl-6-methoxyphenol hydroxylase-like FAD-dependent oxidoreductase
MPGRFSTDREERTADVVVVGAGPVGLTLALALGREGVEVLLLEQREELRETSRAIGITPASLEIFHRYGVAEELAAVGVPVREAAIHGDRGEIARVGFDSLRTAFPFILSLPQRRTEETLLRALGQQPSVRLLRGYQVTGYTTGTEGVEVTALAGSGNREEAGVDSHGGGEALLRGRLLCGCDGKHSTIRRAMGAGWAGRALSDTFAMADIVDDTELGETAHLWFTSGGSVESFPLPGGVRRWIVQTPGYDPAPPPGLVQRLAESRSGVELRCSRELWRSSFRTERRESSFWTMPPAFLAGDAAHLMPPIGGQGMNIGLGDAEHLGDLLSLGLAEPRRLGELAATYEERRRRAFRAAAGRSIIGMKIGTGEGWVASRLREILIPAAVAGRRGERVMEHFAMLAAPNRRSPWGR